MRILIISTLEFTAWGGSEELWVGAARCLAESGHEVLVLRKEFTPMPKPLADTLISGVRFAPIPVFYSPAWPERIRRWLRRIQGISHELQTLRRHVNSFRPDYVFVAQAGQYDGHAWLEACHVIGVRYVLMVQAAHDFWWPTHEHRELLARLFSSAKRCYFVSRANRDLVRLQLGEPLPRSEVVWNPYNLPRDTPPTWPDPDTPLSLACVGRLEPGSKGQDLLFRVLSQPKWRERSLKVALYGKGVSEDVLRIAAADLPSVEFRGFADDIAAVWRSHHALVLPSRVEGMPLAAIEAMMAHRMCIVTDVAGNAEIVYDNINGFVAAGATMNALDEAMERAWLRRYEWRELGLRAGCDIRALIPNDPCRTFAETLASLAQPPTGE